MDDLFAYLSTIGARYFLVPTEKYFSRSTYESVLTNSTLFKLINKSKIITLTNGERLKFESLGNLRVFELYTIISLPHLESIDMHSGQYSLSEKNDFYGFIHDGSWVNK